MNITVKESTMVRPAKDTPNTNLWSTNLDLLLPMFHVQTLYFYKSDGSSSFFEPQVLKNALSQVLVPFYPAAGRMGRDKNGRIEICCNAEGALFIVAETSCVMDDHLSDYIESLKSLPLVPEIDYSGDISSYPLLVLQVTYFKCAGVSLGVGLHHTLADGKSGLHLINSWAAVARGLPVCTPPIFDRVLLKARDPPNPIFHHAEYDPAPTINCKPVQSPESSQSQPKITRAKIMRLTSELLGSLKAKHVNEESTTKYSTYETLAAHIWSCACKARGLNDDQATKLYINTDGRSRLNPPVPPGYFGNVLFIATVPGISGEIQSKPLIHTMKKIHATLKRMDDEYLRSALDYLQMQPDLTVLRRGAETFGCPNINVVSWTSLPIHDADFGWGRPILMGPRIILCEGCAYVLRSPINDYSLCLVICLETEHMQLFEKYLFDV